MPTPPPYRVQSQHRNPSHQWYPAHADGHSEHQFPRQPAKLQTNIHYLRKNPYTLELAALQVGYPNPSTDTTPLTCSVAGHVILGVVYLPGYKRGCFGQSSPPAEQYTVTAAGLAASVCGSELTAGQFGAVQPIILADVGVAL